ncbi:MAG: hypothetical protein AABY32_04440 [Nanoarchaeota archaeon]
MPKHNKKNSEDKIKRIKELIADGKYINQVNIQLALKKIIRKIL